MRKTRIGILGMFFMMLLCTGKCFASEDYEDYKEEALENFCRGDKELESLLEYTGVETENLTSNLGEGFSVNKLYNGNDYLGYYIYNADNGVIYELSLNPTPYDEIILQESLEPINCELLYDNGECAIEYVDVLNNTNFRAATGNNIITKVLPGVSPQLQNDYICMVGAASNMMFYWSWHGYPYLNKYSSWNMIEKYVDIAYANTYRNDYVPTVLSNYIHSYYPNVKVTSQTIWNPSVSVGLCEIDNSRPFMLGFAAGVGSYSETVGHMTMCYGYKKQNINGNAFYSVLLADGHESKGVYKVWNSKINDCIITLKLGN